MRISNILRQGKVIELLQYPLHTESSDTSGGLYLKFTGFGAALMALIFFAVGGVCGWLGKMFYDKFIAPVIKTE